jgi:hypothetical protein
MKIEFAMIPPGDVPEALRRAEAAARATETGNIALLDEATAALKRLATSESAPVLTEVEWRGVTRIFGQAVTHGELDFVVYGDALNRWSSSAREAGAVRLAEWLHAAKAAGNAVLQLPRETDDE